jgi:mono/diheme cytochrome c family protein
VSRLVQIALLALAAPALYAAEPAYPQGAAGFQANCAVCHGPAGAGLPSVAPPLLNYPAQYAASVEGRRQLAMTVLYGLFGAITVSGKPYDFRMPDFARLDDATLAATLNFVVFDLGHASPSVQPLTAADITAERAKPTDGAGVREHRKSVAPTGP